MTLTASPAGPGPGPGPGPAPAPAAQPRLRDPQHRALTLGVVGVVVSLAFEAIGVATAMPVAARELGGLRAYALAFSVFLTASLLGMVLAGEVADRRGPVLPFVSGSGLFGLGLVLAGAAPTMGLLVAARALQGLGAGLTVVALYVVVARAYPATLRPRVFSAMSGGWVVPALVGPPVAGFLADQLSWRWVFLGVLPLTAAGVLLVLPWLRRLPAVEPVNVTPARASLRRSRLVPAAVAALGVAMLQVAGQHGPWVAVPLAGSGVALLVVGVPRLLPSGALRLACGLPTVVVMRGVFAGAFFGAETFVPLMLVEQRGLSTTLAGASLTGGALAWAAGAWYQGRPATRVPRHLLVAGGLALVATGIVLVAAVLSTAVPAWTAAAGMILAGLGMGMGVTSLSVLVLELSPVAEQGSSSAALQVSDALGSILLIAAGGALFAGLHDRLGAAPTFLLIFAVMAVVATVGAGLAPRVRDTR